MTLFAALALLAVAVIAAGTHVVVPMEPTEAMVDAAYNAKLDIYWNYNDAGLAPGGAADVYRAMIAAVNAPNGAPNTPL